MNFLKKHDYIVTVKIISNCLDVTFPNPKLLSSEIPDKLNIISREDDLEPTIYNIEIRSYKNEQMSHKVTKVPDYATRPFVMGVILNICQKFRYPSSLWDVRDINNEVIPFAKILDCFKMPEEISEREKALETIIIASINTGFPDSAFEVAKSENVVDGYKLLLPLFRGDS